MKMAIDSKKIDTEITLELDEDEITVGEFTSALDHFIGLVREVSKCVDKVYPGSAGIGLYQRKGVGGTQLHAVRKAVMEGIASLEKGHRPATFNDKAIEHARSISRVFERRKRPVNSIRLWSGNKKSIAVRKEVGIEASKILDPIFEDYGSVEGRLDVVSGHGKIECTIYDSLDQHPIKCDIGEEHLDDALAAFRRRVEVFGRVHYRKDGLAVRILANKITKFPNPNEVPTIEEMRGILRA